jgi:hypothetical protein
MALLSRNLYVFMTKHLGLSQVIHLKRTTYLLTHSMEQSPSWETNRFAASQEILRILWNQEVHYRIHKYPPPASPIQSIPPHPTSWIFTLKLSSHLRLDLPSGLFPSGFPTKTLHTPLPPLWYVDTTQQRTKVLFNEHYLSYNFISGSSYNVFNIIMLWHSWETLELSHICMKN